MIQLSKHHTLADCYVWQSMLVHSCFTTNKPSKTQPGTTAFDKQFFKFFVQHIFHFFMVPFSHNEEHKNSQKCAQLPLIRCSVNRKYIPKGKPGNILFVLLSS